MTNVGVRAAIETLRSVEIACRMAASRPDLDVATAIADALKEHQELLKRLNP